MSFMLQKKGVTYKQVDAGSEQEERDRLRAISGENKLPQVFVNDEYIGVSAGDQARRRRGGGGGGGKRWCRSPGKGRGPL